MAGNKLSAKEAALIAAARAALRQPPAVPADAPAAAPPVRAEPKPAAAPAALDPEERLAALMAAARAENARVRVRQRKLFVWFPVAFSSVAGLWTLLWMWHRL